MNSGVHWQDRQDFGDRYWEHLRAPSPLMTKLTPLVIPPSCTVSPSWIGVPGYHQEHKGGHVHQSQQPSPKQTLASTSLPHIWDEALHDILALYLEWYPLPLSTSPSYPTWSNTPSWGKHTLPWSSQVCLPSIIPLCPYWCQIFPPYFWCQRLVSITFSLRPEEAFLVLTS